MLGGVLPATTWLLAVSSSDRKFWGSNMKQEARTDYEDVDVRILRCNAELICR